MQRYAGGELGKGGGEDAHSLCVGFQFTFTTVIRGTCGGGWSAGAEFRARAVFYYIIFLISFLHLLLGA